MCHKLILYVRRDHLNLETRLLRRRVELPEYSKALTQRRYVCPITIDCTYIFYI